MRNATLTTVLLVLITACATQDDTDASARAGATTDSTPAVVTGEPASVPATAIPDGFTAQNGRQVYDARRAFDITGDGRPETIVLRADGPRVDSAVVTLLVLSTNADTLYRDDWSTRNYFHYEYRNTFTDSAANAKVVSQLQRVLADSAFSSNGPLPKMKLGGDQTGIDRDAIRYDIKESVVRATHSLPAGSDLKPDMYAEMEKVPVPNTQIDSLAKELASMPTFMYFAGGEATYAIAWSNAKKRFIRIFSCC